MELQYYLNDLQEKQVTGDPAGIEVKGVAYDPLRIEPGFIYVAIAIYTQLDKIEIPDGHPLISDAIARGAVCVVVQEPVAVPAGVVKVVVPDSRYALGLLANRYYGFPSEQIKLVGVTGTNGKTTTTHVMESIFSEPYRVGLIGTLYYKINGEIRKSKDTTPEPPDLQAILRQMADQKVAYCFMETSSHGIEFHRLQGCRFRIAVFTNLTQDHLDFHKTMENYLNAKLKLFRWLGAEDYAVINIDDPYGGRFVEATRANVLTYGIFSPADIMAREIHYGISGTRYILETPQGSIDIETRLLGRFNVYNALAGVGAAVAEGIDLEVIKRGLERPIRVAGRMEMVDLGQPFTVVVDYAHTPDGMENVLGLARGLNPRRLITVFGCGGDRDKEKRPIMGGVASRFSDVVILTADNPRTEDPEAILDDITAGCDAAKVTRIIDRHEAIQHAITTAQAGDIVMILGKGHETTQTLMDRTIPFNDREEAEAALAALLKK
ncbi:MAG TPA: UDP-N-acetylmuramoyl-L-alanyl-D-glutamate--2,6-diaminopimelate ligase [bacterium]|nr:UDP-N-acetylmuramoyl-L-alanyl-D-glutamate--2,6-diaminopimelate ligase [bacterium]HQG46313.1 UDP-N-acetylmuramoyl-L-alanyl-D-glutamate--2,6-diaminopimelate ligase [bacterium]HQI50189.1 UDP-N-acetylmuramoyl-L-alanyl-D-glutamate--2,6-diaminopimelate ligase [bacterium]HQJ65019.1 UDP-N-acetylmuramoyl-L-alanyl-D-glutamate--2,6-diaminopimelate ligase [bacterium]